MTRDRLRANFHAVGWYAERWFGEAAQWLGLAAGFVIFIAAGLVVGAVLALTALAFWARGVS